jgi:deoxyribonuclease V
MKIPRHFNARITPAGAIRQQARLARRVREENDLARVRYVAGVDVGFENDNSVARAAVVVLSLPSLEPVAAAVARLPVTFPYVPGLLAYRELPVVLQALRRLKQKPDLFIVDGHGLAHPRRFGIASHLGVLLDMPSIG